MIFGEEVVRFIDHILVNGSLLQMLSEASIDDEPLGHHFPLRVQCRWPGQYRCLTLQDPIKLPEQAYVPMACEKSAAWVWEERADHLAAALTERRPREATIEWMRRWEALFEARAREQGCSLSRTMMGRWKLQAPVLCLRGKHKLRHDVEDGDLRRLRRLRNLLVEHQRRQGIGTGAHQEAVEGDC